MRNLHLRKEETLAAEFPLFLAQAWPAAVQAPVPQSEHDHIRQPKQAAGPDKPGNTGKDPSAAPGPKYAAGGSTKMFGFSPAQSATAGQTGAR